MVAAKVSMSETSFEVGQDYFSLFQIADDFWIDTKQLKTQYLALQQSHHPDNYAGASDADQREAVQKTAYLNQGHDTLTSPLKRAIYMLERRGVSFEADSQTHTDIAFLTEQLELREKLEQLDSSADPFAELDLLNVEAEESYKRFQQEFVDAYQEESWEKAIQTIHKLMFGSKFLEEIRLKEEILED